MILSMLLSPGCSPATTPLNGTPPGSLEAAVPGFYKKKDDEEPVFFPGKKKAAKKGTRSGDRKLSVRKSLTHSPEIFSQFARLQLEPPATQGELASVLEQLRARFKLYQRLAQQELLARAEPLLDAQAAQDTTLPNCSAIPSIVVEASTNATLPETSCSLEDILPGLRRPTNLASDRSLADLTDQSLHSADSVRSPVALSAVCFPPGDETSEGWPHLSRDAPSPPALVLSVALEGALSLCSSDSAPTPLLTTCQPGDESSPDLLQSAHLSFASPEDEAAKPLVKTGVDEILPNISSNSVSGTSHASPDTPDLKVGRSGPLSSASGNVTHTGALCPLSVIDGHRTAWSLAPAASPPETEGNAVTSPRGREKITLELGEAVTRPALHPYTASCQDQEQVNCTAVAVGNCGEESSCGVLLSGPPNGPVNVTAETVPSSCMEESQEM